MPVSVHLLTDTLSNALSEKFSQNQKKSEDNFNEQLVASAKRVILTKIEYEETTQTHSNIIDKLKTKYTVLKLNSGTADSKNGSNNGGNAGVSSFSNSNKLEKSIVLNGNEKNNSGSSSSKNSVISGSSLPQPKRVLFQRENVEIGWRSKKWSTGVGMTNVGNTCYLNSTLQALFHVPSIANWLMSDEHHRQRCDQNGDSHCIICAMANTLLASQTNQSPIKPYLIYQKLKVICRHLIFGRQEDAHEFLRYLIEAMEKSYLGRFKNFKELDQYSKETTPLNQILGGYLKSTVTCLSCHHVSITYQHFEDLLLDITRVSNIQDALNSFFARENLEDSQYKCESCKRKVSATKKFWVERAPIALCIQLKRFCAMGGKVVKSINISEFLDLKPYLSKAAMSHGQNKYIYRLVSMITHIGNSQHCGHYTAIGLSPNKNYYQFDDSCVRQVNIDCVLRTNAYILFYELENQYENVTNGSASVNGINKNVMQNGIGLKSPALSARKDYAENPIKIVGSSLNSNENSKKLFEPNKPKEIQLKQGVRQENETTPKLKTNFVTPFVPSCILKQQQNHSKELTPTKSQLPPSPTTPTSSPSTKGNIPSKNLFTSKTFSTPRKEDTSRSSKTPSPVRNTKHILSDPESCSTSNKRQKLDHAPLSSDSENDDVTEPRRNFVTLPHMPKLLDDEESPKTMGSKYSVESKKDQNGGEPGTSKSFMESSSKQIRRDSSTESTNSRKSHQEYSTKHKEKYNKDGPGSSKSLPDTTKKSYESSNGLKKFNSDSNLLSGSAKNRVLSPVGMKSSGESFNNKKHTENGSIKQHSEPSKTSQDYNNMRKVYNEVMKKPKSLVPYETDDESSDQEEIRLIKKDGPQLVKNQSGVWQVSDLKENNCPSKHGSTVETTKVTKITKAENGFGSHQKNGDVVQELEKFSHRGYGAPVNSWSGNQTQMDKEIAKDKESERKRQLEDDEETEMDRGRIKKMKYGQENSSSAKKLSNPFNVKQNHLNSNGKSFSQQFFQRNHGSNNDNNNHGNNGNRSWVHGNHNRSQYFQNRPHHNNHSNNNNNNNSNNNNYRKFNNKYSNNNHNRNHSNYHYNQHNHHHQRR